MINAVPPCSTIASSSFASALFNAAGEARSAVFESAASINARVSTLVSFTNVVGAVNCFSAGYHDVRLNCAIADVDDDDDCTATPLFLFAVGVALAPSTCGDLIVADVLIVLDGEANDKVAAGVLTDVLVSPTTTNKS